MRKLHNILQIIINLILQMVVLIIFWISKSTQSF
ncbi:unnamed protein product [Paramecium sonneborni]|uniref:Uncharacterized protein n=1 Tax=Paramecium sonneborni TaxID=65129 RepID=A0A8S1RIH2_9CILI|nr:unnamed protein product [Paramecium sonneborni]